MVFRQYSSDEATIKEWSRKLNSTNKGIFRTYSTPESTLYQWSYILNKISPNISFPTYETASQMLNDWEDKLNIIFN